MKIENRPNGIRLVPIAHFYCARDNAEPLRADPDEILRSIARQLSSVAAELPIREPAQMKYSGVREKGFSCRRLSLGATYLIQWSHAPSTHVGMNGLHMTIYYGHHAVIDGLSGKGVDLAKATLRAEIPLHLAARCGHVDLIRLLIGKVANPNAMSFAQVDQMETDSAYEGGRMLSSALSFRDARSGYGSALDEDAESQCTM
jgi:hypothetical protein